MKVLVHEYFIGDLNHSYHCNSFVQACFPGKQLTKTWTEAHRKRVSTGVTQSRFTAFEGRVSAVDISLLPLPLVHFPFLSPLSLAILVFL